MTPSSVKADFRLLVIDDNEAIHTDLKKILMPPKIDSDILDDETVLFGKIRSRTVEFSIDSAFQGQESLDLVQKAQQAREPYALAFVDIRMPPGWNGIETISHLWKEDPNLQIVICTAYSDYSWREIEHRLGLSHNLVILKKPFDPIEVTQLAHALTAKWETSRRAHLRLAELDRLVEERTQQLKSLVLELQRSKELAEMAALEDPLTKLANRRLFQNRLGVALHQGQRDHEYLCALLYLDVDRFKVINDSLGHLAGDELLIEVANRIQSCLRSGGHEGHPTTNDTVARLGGDEFAVLLDGIRDSSDALRVAQRVANQLAMPFSLRGKNVSISASIGIATSASQYISAETMLRDADTAMYRAKAAGRGGCVLFDESMHKYAVERLHKESELRQALERAEFFLCYQPIISLKTFRIESFEALLRWRSRTRGLIPPFDFIPLSEETGLIIPIGEWVLREASRQARLWFDRLGPELAPTVSVNLSARQFMQPDLVSNVQQALLDSGLSGSSLRLELTETAAMAEPERAEPMLRELQELGVRLSIDDFGTGYSSLNYLHRFSVDTLKIDRHFVGKMNLDERDMSIVRTIVSLAHNLSMDVVAEGVETSEQVSSLCRIRCDAVQGYYFSHPLAAEQVDELLSRNPDLRVTLSKGAVES